MGDGRDGPGRLDGDRRVRPGGAFGLLALRGAVRRDRGGLAGVGQFGGGLLVAGVSAGGASGAAAGCQVSAMPGRLPLTRVAAPFFSQASRACRAAGTLIPARAAMTATGAPAGSADRVARTAAAGLPPATGERAQGPGPWPCRRRCGPRARRGRGCVP
jgi:hypothetical protein